MTTNQEKQLYVVDLARACEVVPRLSQTIPHTRKYFDGSTLRPQYTYASSPDQAMTQILMKLGNPDYRPRWVFYWLKPNLGEVVQPAPKRERGSNLKYQLPLL